MRIGYRQKLCALFLPLIFHGCAGLTSSSGDMNRDEIVNELLSNMSPHDGPGIQYVVVDKDSVLFSSCTGLADISRRTPMTLHHTMSAFSMTKMLTAVAVLQLADRGKIKLDDPVSRYVTHPYGSTITVRQLLSHTSGAPNPIPLRWVHLAAEHFSFEEKNALAEVLEDNPDLDAKPGERYSYSNIGYWLLGEIIERSSGLSYAEYLEEEIFQPLGLKNSEIGFQIHDESNHAKGYLKKWSFMNFFGRFFIDSDVLGEYEDGWLHIQNVYVNGPAYGGVLGTANAIGRILRALLSDNTILLNRDARRLLYETQTLNSGERIDITLGWHIGHLDDIKYFYKEGGGAGYRSEMRIYPAHGIGSVLMTNRTSFDTKGSLKTLDTHFIDVQQ